MKINMNIKEIKNNKSVMNAIYIGTLCSVVYLGVYFARNILGAVTPEMVECGYTEGYIGKVSSFFFVFYAVGQLINGAIGDKINARYMMCVGLFMAGITNVLFSLLSVNYANVATVVYGFTGFFLAMIFGPMTKLVAENTEPIYATRCSLGYTFASFFGSPVAGVAAAMFVWQSVFFMSSAILVIMAVVCFLLFLLMEKKGIVKYNQYTQKKEKGGSIKILIKHRIIKFSFISMLTGVVRTTVVFWLPTYISQYLGFSTETSALLFTVATFIISFATFVSIFVYEKLKRNMDLTILVMFLSSTLFFMLVYLVKQPVLNIFFIIVAIMSANGAATMLWSRYCPSLRDTGMVSGATGFLDFISYMAAAISSTIFANAVYYIGWGNLILVWFGLMAAGVFTVLPYDKIIKKKNIVELD